MKIWDRLFGKPETEEPEVERTWWRVALPGGVYFIVCAHETEIREAFAYGESILIENKDGVRRILNSRQVLYFEPSDKGVDS